MATIEPGRLYAIDYDAGEPIGWSAVHLPKGGTGFIKTAAGGDTPWLDPYVSGLCFRKAEGGVWAVTAQTSTSL